MANTTKKRTRRADQYNDPNHNYLYYWNGRDYEHRAEVLAIQRLLSGKHFDHAVDIGGGYGRLSTLLTMYATKVTLAEPSEQQLEIAKTYLKDYPTIERKLMQADNLLFKDGEIDLVMMVRVMHHLPEHTQEFQEIARVLRPGGVAVIEMANYMHARNRLKHFIRRQKFSEEPVDIRSMAHRSSAEIPFVNHNPYTIIKQLRDCGFHVDRILTVSNLRSTTLKKVMPLSLMLALESGMQTTLARTFFGPSIFFLVSKMPTT